MVTMNISIPVSNVRALIRQDIERRDTPVPVSAGECSRTRLNVRRHLRRPSPPGPKPTACRQN